MLLFFRRIEARTIVLAKLNIEHPITNLSSRDFSIIISLVFAAINGFVSSINCLSVNSLQVHFLYPSVYVSNIKAVN